MLGSPPASPFVDDKVRVPPHPANHSPESFAWAADDAVQQAIGIYLGFNRRLPAEVIDPTLAKALYDMTRDRTPAQVVMDFATQPGDWHRKCLVRAVYHNLAIMRREGNGRLPWEM